VSKDTITLNTFIPGQRWSSNSEPELGLGIIESIDQQFVNILFPACDELRQYSTESPPLHRMRFQPGATIQDVDGQEYQVQQVSENDGLIVYHCGKEEILESKLGANMADRGPEERLVDGQATESSLFDLRLNSLKAMFEWRRSPVRGLYGGKMDLIPHQLYIAHEVSNRQSPRVLLADEVGLGKTIEACLILNRLLTCGRANRVLILVPGSLVHQWFVELLRRFNHWFNIFDEERCLSIESGQECTNPFEDDQLILADIDWLSQSPKRVNQVIASDWDLLVVDEAHHLKWNSESPSEKYKLVDQLGQKAHALLLLTATPEQVGLENHFARLRLLDHSRFSNFEKFKSETEKYKPVAILCQKLINDEPLNDSELDQFPVTESTLSIAKSEIAKNKKLSIETKDKFIRELADRHGTGRVLFRNTRKTITGFPKRFAKIYSIKNNSTSSTGEEEFNYDINLNGNEPNHDFSNDPRIDWLTKILKDNELEKFLLICRTQAKTAEIENSLRDRINIKTAVFHEELNLVQRDRNAAWFADQDGARLLICSEIGSEGRNFQFCHHLILFDLPINPELIEQRIGRLDRIGQINDIRIHIPTIENSQRERLAKWQHYGLNAYEENIPGGQTLITQYRDQLLSTLKDKQNNLDKLIKETKKSRKELQIKLEQGKDQLIEINSHSANKSDELIGKIRKSENSSELESLMLRLFDIFGIGVDDIGKQTYRLTNTERLPVNIPGNRSGTVVVTFDRILAVSRDDQVLLSWDHPIVTGCIEQLLASHDGTASFAIWETSGNPTLLLEVIYVLECLAPKKLHADRFLPPTPVRIVINHQGKPVLGEDGRFIKVPELIKDGPSHIIAEIKQIQNLIKPMSKASEKLASDQIDKMKSLAIENMNQALKSEISRLETLIKINKNIREDEITSLKKELSELQNCLDQSRTRIDSIRLIWKGEMSKLNQLATP
tara:strand:+ start:3330 stop:6191 length:2862 start_codon:yes stop_codon:yes gene_type:complete